MPIVNNRNLRPGFRWRRCLVALAIGLAGAAAMAAADPKASRLYEDALTRFDAKDYKGSIIQLKNALQIDKTMLPVQVLLGRALLADGQAPAAEVAFMEAIRLGVNRAEVVAPMAEAVIAQGNQPQVLKDERFATTGLPPGVQARLMLLRASAAADVGDAREAMRQVEQARALDPSSPGSWLAEVPIRIRARQYDEAVVAADKALALAPGSADGLYQRAQIEHVRGNPAAALAGYGRALAADAGHIDAYISRAGLLMDQNRMAEAKADVAQVRQRADGDPRGAYLTALIAEREGDLNASRAALKDITRLIDPIPLAFLRYRPQILMLTGLAHHGLSETEKAKPYLEAYQKLDPGGGVSKLLAQIHLGENNVQFAVDVLDAYLRVRPMDSQAQALLAAAHMAQGRTARATYVAQEALKRNDAPELRTALGMSLLRSGQPGNAVAEFENAFKRDPSQVGAGAALVGLYIQAGQPDRAMAVADALVKRQPASAAFLTLLGQARLAKGDRKGARAALENATRLQPALLGPQVQLARLDAVEGQFDRGLQRLNELLAKDERNADLMLELALLYGQRERPDDAQRWLEKAVDVAGPRDVRAALALVELHMRRRKLDAAHDVAKAAAAKVPGELTPQMALARVQLARNDRDGARLSLNTATRLANFDAPLQVEIGLLQLLAGNVAGAAYSFDKALSSQPDMLPAQAAMVDVEIRRGELSQAEQRAKAIAAKNPQRAVGHSLIADVAWARGELPVALDAYRKAHRLEPSTQSAIRLADALLRTEGAKPALALLEQWTRARTKDRTALDALAGMQARTGQWAQARASYEALLKTTPDDPVVLNNLASVLLLLKAPEAVATAERALALAPGDIHATDTLGWALFQNGQTERALQLLRDARLRDPSMPTVRYHLAAVLAKTGRTAEAKTELQQALAISPRFEGSEDARALLKSLP